MLKAVKVKRSRLLSVGHNILRILRDKIAHEPNCLTICNFDGVNIALDCSDPLQLNIFRAGQFEPELSRVLYNMVEPGDVIVDIGANVGWHSLTLLVKCPGIRACYAYEPADSAYQQLLMGVVANHSQDRCYTSKLCLGDRKSTTTIKHFSGLGTLHSSIYPLADYPFTEEVVELDTLDHQVSSYDAPVRIIKCDVEGSERDVLLGAKGVLSGAFGPPPIWFLEANYETAGMGGFFPWELIDIAQQSAPYEAFVIRQEHILPLSSRTSLRHGDTLILAITHIHQQKLDRTLKKL
jgi:FkbM family methyltransferase